MSTFRHYQVKSRKYVTNWLYIPVDRNWKARAALVDLNSLHFKSSLSFCKREFTRCKIRMWGAFCERNTSLTLGRTRGMGGDGIHPPRKVFLSFSQRIKHKHLKFSVFVRSSQSTFGWYYTSPLNPASSADLGKLAIEDCVRDIDAWMTLSMFKMNRD